MKKPSAISRIAAQFSDPRNVSKAVEAQKARHRTQAAYELPANPTEETVSAIWSKLLAIDRVGRNDNFFLMGGHSLLATQMLARVRDTYNVELPLKALFESPVLASFAEKIESHGNSGAIVERPTPRLRGNTAPLSYAQQRLWFIDQLEPDSALYNVPQMYRMHGALKVEALERALNEIVRRHEGLRTTFAGVDGQPVQVIAEEVRLPLSLVVVDEAEARRRAREEALRPFGLAQGPLLRATLLRVEEDEHVLLLTLHHIVSDGWSGNLLAAEMAALYEAFAQNRPSPLPELAIQYADYVVWQREWLQGEVLHKGVAYWREHLAGAPAVLELPADRPRPAVQRHRGAMCTHVIPRQLVDSLRVLSQAEGATLYMTLLAGFQLLLSRYSGQEDIVVGSTVAGRNYAEIEPLIGYFANTLALRSDLSGNPTFRELLARVKKVALDAYAHQEIPFEKLVEELQPERSLSYNPIFQVLFGLQNLPRQAYEVSSLRVERMSVHPETSIFDMSWFAFEKVDGLLLRVEYDTDLYEDATIARALGHYEKLLEGIAAHPESALSELPLLTSAEQSQMVEWNATAADYPRELCVHQLFEQQTERTPGAVACVFDQDQLSYDELNQRANQLAHYLKRRGAGPGQRVGIFLERSLDMMVALLGVQKTGAAYVPLDRTYPAERLRLILEEAQAPLLLTQSSLLESLPRHDSEIICLDRDGRNISQQERSNPPREGGPEDLIYVIFTSGSTGRPKGVQVPHRAVVNLLSCMTRQLQMGPEDVFPALASFAFDMCIPELYLPLVSGGRVAIGRRHLAGDGEELAAFLRRHGATIVHATPTTWDLLLEAGFTGRGLKRIIGAEALPQDLCDRLLEADASLYNYYGPTETTVWSTMHHFQIMDEPVVVGRPLANTQVYILDRRLRTVPIGVPGEIFIAGDGVTHGYLNEPELTAEKFLPDPFTRSPGRKMYRTGDLGRFLADGRIEFWGRADNQVKIRGFRIELGEVEAALGQHPAVREAVVVAREDVPGDKRLVGYVVTVDQQAVPAAELRAFVKQKLPEYMVPVAWVQLERFPLTANGKVDRRNLPAPEYRRQDQEHEYVAPRTPAEEVIGSIWAEVLKLDRVGVEDNFFELGGHSLLGTQVVSRIRQTLGVELPLRALFEAPTVAGLAERITVYQREQQGMRAVPLQRVKRGNTLALSYAQQRLWFIDQLEPGSALYNVPQMYRMHGALKVEALERALNEIVRRHEGLRTTFAGVDGQPVQVIAEEVRLPLSLVVVDEAEARRRAREEALRPFGLAQGPLLRATLLRVEEDEHVLLLTLHHIVSDGWSGNLLAAEMAALYEAFAQNRPSPLPELAIQYADYVVWQREWLQGEVLHKGVAYWREHLAGAPAVLELPADRPRPAVQRHRGAMCTHVIPRQLVDSLRVLSQAEGATLYMTLLAGFQLLLSRYSGQEDIVVGSTVAGRNYAEIEPLIGYFANTLALRSDLSGNPTFRELLARVKKVALDAYAHQEIPFEKLVEELQPERSLSYNPIFQVLFGLQNLPRQAYEVSSLRVERMSVHPETSIFDMSWFAFEKVDGLLLRVEYDTDLYEDATIARALGHYEKLLEGIAAHPESALSELPLLTSAEQSQMVEWNATAADYPRELCVHQLFEQQTERTPGAVACVFDQDQLSYDELNQRANQLAHYLKRRGAGPGQRVGIFLERSLDMMVALLGVQKTGAAYVPLDRTYPAERLRLILEEAQAPLLLTQSSLLESLPRHDSEIICLDRDGRNISQQERSNPPREGGPEDLIYVIFTSGSTGRPKGVQVPHRAVVNLLCCMTRQLQMGPEDVFPALASFAFDMCIPELYLPLVSGGRVAIGRRHLAGDGEELAAFLRRHGATVVHATPTTWDLLLEAGFTGRGLKRVIGAEALPQDLCDRLLEADASLYNYYGPTETTVWSTMHHFQSMDEPVVVGRPLANTQVYILDRRLRTVPIGIPGEIFIGGDGVTHGYLNEPELTAEKFLEDPFARTPGRKMYRTGDLGRFLADGRIEFWGRADNQVKIRGFRIELGEVEAVLGQHPAVRETVVVAREDVPGDKRLVGYVVTVDQQAVPAAELRGFVKQRLPEYMVPVAWVQLERFPLTANGKVDRRNLPAPEYRRQDQEQEYVAPRTPAEEVIGSIWAEVLKLDRVGVEDNFFELGGHSLLGTQVVSRIRQTLGVELPLRALFEAPTVAGLAERITVYQREQQGMRAVPLQRVKRGGPLPLSYAQQRLWFIDQLEPGSALYNLPRPIRMSGALHVDALEKALNDLVQRHEILRTTYGVENDQPVQVIASQLTIPLPLFDLSGVPAAIRENEARRIVEEEAGKAFNLAEGPMLRALLVRLGAGDHILVLNTHHIASDGWSGGVLIRDLAAFYQAALEGKRASLPELTIQYADYAVWQRNWLQGEILEKRLTYWRSRLDGAPPVLTLPADRPRPPVQTFHGATERSVLPKSLADDVLALSHQQGATTFMTLLAAFQSLLFYFSRETDIVLGTDIANRTTVQTEDLIGFFVNLLVFRTDLSGDPSFADLVHRVREVALGAYAHQEIPFEKLVEELQPERTLSYNPLVQALFVEFNLPRGTFQIPGLELSWFKLDSPSKFDLAVFIGEGENGTGTTWLYNPDLFDASTISRMMHLYKVALETVIVDPAIRLSALLQRLSETEQRRRATEHKEFEEVSLQKLKQIKRRAAKEMST